MHISPEEREALKQEIFASLHCALPGTVVSFDEERQTAEVQPAIALPRWGGKKGGVGSLLFPLLSDVPVFMPVPFEVHPGDACLVVFADADIDGWFETGEPQETKSARKHSLSDGFAFVGWRRCGAASDQ